MKKYSWDFDESAEIWDNDTFDTIEECVKDALENKEGDETSIFVGENKRFKPKVDSEIILDRMMDQAWEEVGEVAERWDSYDYSKSEEIEELDTRLTEVVMKWFEEFGYSPNMWSIENIIEVSLIEGLKK